MCKTAHYHAMNGSSGCLPDYNEVHTSKEDAIELLMGDFEYRLTPAQDSDMRESLANTGIYYFGNPAEAGADYAEVTACNEPGCLIDRG